MKGEKGFMVIKWARLPIAGGSVRMDRWTNTA